MPGRKLPKVVTLAGALRATSRSHTISSRRPTTTATAPTPSAGAQQGHTFSDLTSSDKAGFQILRPNGTIAVSFNIDYITASTLGSPPSGYKSLGPFGGDGSIVVNSSPALVNNGTPIRGIRRLRGT